MSKPKIVWSWHSCECHADICGVVALGHIRNQVLTKLLNFENDELFQQLKFVSFAKGIVLIGQKAVLPWVDGVDYIRVANNEPRLWLPSTLQPSVPVALLAEAFYQYYQISPLLLWPNPKIIIPLNQPESVSRMRLQVLMG